MCCVSLWGGQKRKGWAFPRGWVGNQAGQLQLWAELISAIGLRPTAAKLDFFFFLANVKIL